MFTRAALPALLTAVAFPALAQPTPSVDVAAVLARATPEAQAVFAAADDKLIHKASGFSCPAAGAGTTLSGVGLGALPGQPGDQAAHCEYSDETGVVERLVFAKEAPTAPVLDQAFCQGLPKAFKLTMGAGALPGNSKFTPPMVSSTGPVTVRGETVPVWHCGTTRPPYALPTIVFHAAAARPPGGWTVLALHTPPPPPCCRGYRDPLPRPTFFVRPLLMVERAIEASPVKP